MKVPTNIRTLLLAAGAASSLSIAVPRAQGDAAAHKAWMDDAADAQDELKEALAAKTLAKQVGAAAKARSLTRANTAFAKMNTTCNSCHDLHPEKRP